MVVYCPDAVVDLADYGIRLPLTADRYHRVHDALAGHPRQGPVRDRWLRRITPPPATRADLDRVHSAAFLDALLAGDPAVIRPAYDLDEQPQRDDTPRAERSLRQLVEHYCLQAGGTIEACRVALDTGFAYYLGGGYHHAMTAAARGFCLVNDIVVAIRRLQSEGRIRTAWVIDIDAHRGDGTAELTIDDPSVATLSLHMARGWPLDGDPLDPDGRLYPWYYPGTVDIGVPAGQEHAYLDLLRAGLLQLEVSQGGILPDLAVVADGSDPWEHDRLESAKLLRLPLDVMVRRDRLVYEWFARRGVPQVYVMTGGYGPDNWAVHAGFLETVLCERLGV